MKKFYNPKNLIALLIIGFSFLFLTQETKAQCTAGFTFKKLFRNVQFTNTSTGTNPSTVYFWTLGDGNFNFTANFTHIYTSNGTFFVSLNISDSTGCSSIFRDTITVTNSNTCTASFNSSINGATASFVSTSAGTHPSTRYNWDFGDGNTSTQQNPVHTFAMAGTYAVCLSIVDSANNCQDNDCSSVVASNPLPCTINFVPVPNQLRVNFINTSQNVPAIGQYAWNFGDGNSSSVRAPIHNYASSGTYNVTLVISDSLNICLKTQSKMVTVMGMGISETAFAKSIEIFPNPVQNLISIEMEMKKAADVSIQIQNLLGQKIQQENFNVKNTKQNIQLDASNLIPGVYFIEIESEGSKLTQKFVKH